MPLCPACRLPLSKQQARPRLIAGIQQQSPSFVYLCRNATCREVFPEDYFIAPSPAAAASLFSDTPDPARPHRRHRRHFRPADGQRVHQERF